MSATSSSGMPLYQSGLTQFTAGAGVVSLGVLPGLSFQGQNPFTVEVWVYPDALVDQMTLVSCANEFTLQAQGANLSVGRTNQPAPLTATNVLQELTWTYIAVTFDGATMSLYVNGALLSQLAISDQGATTTGNPVQLGGSFYGQISACRVWNQAVNVLNIASHQWVDYPSNTLGLLAQIDLTISPPADSSGNNGQPTLSPTGVSYFSYVAAAGFTGTSFADPYNDETVNPGGSAQDFSVLAWVSPSLLPEEQFIFTNGPQESNAGMTLGLNASGNVCFQVGDSAVLTSNATLQVGQWYYVAATWSASSTTGTLYIGGTQDSTSSTMTLAGSMSPGVPLLGAIASTLSDLPIATFQGYIQSISVWSSALTAAEVTQYMSEDPLLAESCVADYDLAYFPARNSRTFNPVGLVVGTQYQLVPLLPPGLDLAARRARPQQPLAPPAPPEADALLTAEEAASRADFEGLLASLPLSEMARAHARDVLSATLRRAATDRQQHRYRGLQGVQILTLPNGHTRLLLSKNGVPVVAYEGELDPCTVWVITLVSAIVGALLSALGFPFEYEEAVESFTTVLGTRISGIAPRLVEIFSPGVTATAIYNALKLLNKYSMLVTLLSVAWDLYVAASFWVIADILLELASLLVSGPASAIVLVAQLAYSIYSLVGVIQAKPAGCYAAPAPAAPMLASAVQ